MGGLVFGGGADIAKRRQDLEHSELNIRVKHKRSNVKYTKSPRLEN